LKAAAECWPGGLSLDALGFAGDATMSGTPLIQP
jgi:hypothetical protein